MNQMQKELVIVWINRFHSMAKAHCVESVRSEKQNIKLGIPVVIFTTAAGTTIFATLQGQSHIYIKIFIGIISLSAAILASLQTFLKFSERSVKHREAAFKYEILQKELEQILAFPPANDNELDKRLTQLRNAYQELAGSYPNIPEHIWNAAKEYVNKQNINYPSV